MYIICKLKTSEANNYICLHTYHVCPHTKYHTGNVKYCLYYIIIYFLVYNDINTNIFSFAYNNILLF